MTAGPLEPVSASTVSEPGLEVKAAPAAMPGAHREFELLVERRPPGLVRRFLVTQRHFFGILFGGLSAWVRARPRRLRRGIGFQLARLAALATRPFVKRSLVKEPFPVQLRRRLELLGVTYIKLGQILSLREDILPRPITEELKLLLDRLPALAPERFVELVSREVGRPAEELFDEIEAHPLGSASIGQTHRARTRDGEPVILKMVKPGIRETLRRDVVLLKLFGSLLQLLLSRFQPRKLIDEFCEYTLREVDLRLEADNAETFAANFRDEPDVVFPTIYREHTTENLLVMEELVGVQPNDPEALALSDEDKARVVDVGAEAIIRMLYRDGFFHADLHPGNLLLLPGPKAGFIDLGMVGRFDDALRRTLLYYYYCLVMGDMENAARYLASTADPGPGGDLRGFRKDVEEVCRRWRRHASFEEFSIGQLILESVAKGGAYHVYFPVEMVLMVKALVTFEGVGHQLLPGFDVAAVSQPHINKIFLAQFSPLRLARESLRGAPELVDALLKAPMLVTEGVRALEQATQRRPENPFTGIRGTVFGGFCLVAGAVVAASQGPWPLWAGLIGFGAVLALRRGS